LASDLFQKCHGFLPEHFLDHQAVMGCSKKSLRSFSIPPFCSEEMPSKYPFIIYDFLERVLDHGTENFFQKKKPRLTGLQTKGF